MAPTKVLFQLIFFPFVIPVKNKIHIAKQQ